MPTPSRAPVVGVDLGGTTIKAALVSPELEILDRAVAPTDLDDQARLLDELVEVVDRVRDGVDVAGAGFGLPSQIDQVHGRIADSVNVPLEDVDFAAEMERRLRVPVAIDNDANVACLAESRIGAARGARHVVMVTLGTGIGGGLLLDGEIYRGSSGAGAELGHMVVAEDGPPCQGHCPNRGCLEVLASATGVVRAAREIAARRPGGALAAAEGPVTAHEIIERARAGDPEAVEALAVAGGHLGVGIANYVNIFNPELVVVGGGLSAAGELLLGPAREVARRRGLRVAGSQVRVVQAQLGNDAGVLGAAALVL